jgi:hypothetical protein
VSSEAVGVAAWRLVIASVGSSGAFFHSAAAGRATLECSLFENQRGPPLTFLNCLAAERIGTEQLVNWRRGWCYADVVETSTRFKSHRPDAPNLYCDRHSCKPSLLVRVRVNNCAREMRIGGR